ncbi:MAG: hypothetical protein RSB37_00690 [Acetivibrio sp.]
MEVEVEKKEGQLSKQKIRQIPLHPKKMVAGYDGKKEELVNKTTPVEIMRMKNENGIISVGINKKKEIVLAVTECKEGKERGEREHIMMSRAQACEFPSDKLYVNSHSPEESAFIYQTNGKKNAGAMIRRLKTILKTQRNETAKLVTPFLLQKEEEPMKKEKREEEERYLLKNLQVYLQNTKNKVKKGKETVHFYISNGAEPDSLNTEEDAEDAEETMIDEKKL